MTYFFPLVLSVRALEEEYILYEGNHSTPPYIPTQGESDLLRMEKAGGEGSLNALPSLPDELLDRAMDINAPSRELLDKVKGLYASRSPLPDLNEDPNDEHKKEVIERIQSKLKEWEEGNTQISEEAERLLESHSIREEWHEYKLELEEIITRAQYELDKKRRR